MNKNAIILGAGVTGLTAGLASGLQVFEATHEPGGICSSYYVRPGEQQRLHLAPLDEEAYRFEVGGGHWIFGGDPAVLRFIESVAPMKRYSRLSAVFLHERNAYIPYPLQDHLRCLDNETCSKALQEVCRPRRPFTTMKEWIRESFGATLSELFFEPFHDLYTAGLHQRIGPQDPHKSPLNLAQVIRGAFEEAPPAGYNVSYGYPVAGLNTLAQWMAARSDVRYGKRVVTVEPARKEVTFADGSGERYEALISTLPLNRMMELTSLQVDSTPDPFTSVLVLNIGAVKGEACPEHHWIYVPRSLSGFHRVGFYSNVDPSFLPRSARKRRDHVSIYVERAYLGGAKPTKDDMSLYAEAVVRELRSWRYIEAVEVLDPTWIDVAYTWSWPGSNWAGSAQRVLEAQGIYPIGRYGRWSFQGIADSMEDGFFVGGSFRHDHAKPRP